MTSTMTQMDSRIPDGYHDNRSAFLTPSLQVGVISDNQSEGGIRVSLSLSQCQGWQFAVLPYSVPVNEQMSPYTYLATAFTCSSIYGALFICILEARICEQRLHRLPIRARLANQSNVFNAKRCEVVPGPSDIYSPDHESKQIGWSAGLHLDQARRQITRCSNAPNGTGSPVPVRWWERACCWNG